VAIPAGKNMTEHYHSKGTADENIESLDISTKSCQSDFATAIDVKNENFIAGEISKAFPDHEVSLLWEDCCAIRQLVYKTRLKFD
jgi:fructose-1,6-bisphosphatase/inositol monophosphatase family enzyme